MGTGEILASNISCNGSEYDLYMCPNTTDIPDVCTHERDAALSCQPGSSESFCTLLKHHGLWLYIIMLHYFLFPVDMNITVDPRTQVVAGNVVTLWCNASSPSVANLTSFEWRNSQGAVTPDGSRINITVYNASYSYYYGAFIFNSSLTFSPIMPSDGDRYECELTIGLPEVGVNISNTTTADIRILGL